MNVSDPIVPFRETIVVPPKVDMVNEAIENNTSVKEKKEEDLSVQLQTPYQLNTLHMVALPLPEGK